MKKMFTILFIAFGMYSCTTKNKLYVVFDNVEGLYTKSKVQSEGVEIGRVVDMGILPDNRILVEVELEGFKNVPNDSKFIIEKGLFESALQMKMGTAGTYFKTTDTIVGENKSSLGVEKVNKVGRSVESIFTAANKQDSILEKLTRIEKKLDALHKK